MTGEIARVGFASQKVATAVVFLSARCPCSRSHEARLDALVHAFPSVAFVGVHSNADESEAEARAHFGHAGLDFPVVQDHGGALADRFGALKTPHVFVIAPDGRVLFQGGVDDSHDAARAKNFYLQAALEAIVAGRTPERAEVRALGCVIRR